MAGYLSIPAEKIRTVPLGHQPARLRERARVTRPVGANPNRIEAERERERRTRNGVNSNGVRANGVNANGVSKRPFTVGYFARIAPEKGLDKLAAAYRLLRKERGLPPSRLEVAGYLGGDQREYLDRVELMLRQAGLHTEYRYHGELDRAQKVAFFKQIDVFSMPTPYREPKGFSVLEAMASGVPVRAAASWRVSRGAREHERRIARQPGRCGQPRRRHLAALSGSRESAPSRPSGRGGRASTNDRALSRRHGARLFRE